MQSELLLADVRGYLSQWSEVRGEWRQTDTTPHHKYIISEVKSFKIMVMDGNRAELFLATTFTKTNGKDL